MVEAMGAQGLGWEGEGFTPGRDRRRARLAAHQGQFDRGRHLGGQPQRGLQARAGPARPEVDEQARGLFWPRPQDFDFQDEISMADFGGDAGGLPGRGAGLAGGELPQGPGEATRWRQIAKLQAASRRAPTPRPGARRMGAKGWGAPDLAEGIRRRRPLPRRGHGAGRGDGRDRRPQPDRRHGHRSMFGPTLLEYGTEALKRAAPPGHRQRRGALVPGLLRAGRRLRPRLACRPAPRTRATTAWSTARRSGPAARSTPTGASAWCAPTRPRSTRASASC